MMIVSILESLKIMDTVKLMKWIPSVQTEKNNLIYAKFDWIVFVGLSLTNVLQVRFYSRVKGFGIDAQEE